MLSNMRKALDGLSNKELISHKPRSGRISESAKSHGSNKKEIEEAIKKFFNLDEKVSINDEQVIEQLDSDTLRELISMFDKYEYGGVSVQVNNRIYVIEFNLEEDDCYLKVEDYADLFNEKGIDPFIYAEPIGPLKKNKKFQQAWRFFKLSGEPKFINGKAINKGVKIYHPETQEDYDALMKEFEERGYKWESGDRPSQVNAMKFYKNPVGIKLSKGRLSHLSLDYYKEENPQVPIIEYKAKLEKTNGEEINESSSINENTSNANLTKLRKVIKSVYGVTYEFEISETTLKLLNKRAMKEILEHISESYEDRVIVESDKNLYVVDYAVYEDGIYFECTEYQDAWAEGGVDPFEIFTPIGRLAKNKQLQRAWQSVGIGEEPDLDDIYESNIKESARQSDNLYAVEIAGVIRTDIFVQAEDAYEAESKVNKKEFRGHFLSPKNIRVNDVKESYPTDSASSFAVATGNDDLEGRERDSTQGDNWYQLSVAATMSTDIYVEADDMYEAEEKARRTNFTGVFEVPNNLRIDAVFDSWPVDEVPSGTIKIS